MQIEFPDVYGVNNNTKGVKYLYNMYTKEVIAKVCTRCNEWHFLNEFNKAGKGFAGTHSYCRTCHKESDAEYRETVRLKTNLLTKSKYNMETRRNWF